MSLACYMSIFLQRLKTDHAPAHLGVIKLVAHEVSVNNAVECFGK